MSIIIAGTGHRPEDSEPEEAVRSKVRNALTDINAEVFITGCAAGFDLWSAFEAIDLGIEVWAARPWSTHQARLSDKLLYEGVLSAATRIVNVIESDTYPGPWAYIKRNEWMVDNSTHVLAYFNGKEKGGTYACVRYARKVGRPVRNIYA